MVSVSPGYMGEDRRGSYLINRQNGKWEKLGKGEGCHYTPSPSDTSPLLLQLNELTRKSSKNM